MKKFRVRKKKRKIIIVFLVGILILLFYLLSLITLNESIVENILIFLEKKEFQSVNMINNNLNQFISLYNFNNPRKIEDNSLNLTLSLDGDQEILSLLKSNLQKIGIQMETNSNCFGKVIRGNDYKIVTIKKKDYARIKVYLPTDYFGFKDKILHDYPEIIIDVLKGDELLFEVGGKETSINYLNNSTEIIALIIYDIVGD